MYPYVQRMKKAHILKENTHHNHLGIEKRPHIEMQRRRRRTSNYLAGVRFSCISRVSPVIPAACGSDEIYHLK